MSEAVGHQDGDRIRALRKQRELTVRELAGRIGIHEQSLRKIELNRGSAGINVLVRLASELDVQLTDIVRAGNGNGGAK